MPHSKGTRKFVVHLYFLPIFLIYFCVNISSFPSSKYMHSIAKPRRLQEALIDEPQLGQELSKEAMFSKTCVDSPCTLEGLSCGNIGRISSDEGDEVTIDLATKNSPSLVISDLDIPIYKL